MVETNEKKETYEISEESIDKAGEVLLRQAGFLRDLTHEINVAVEEATGKNPKYVPYVMTGGGFFLWTGEHWTEEGRSYPLGPLVRKFLVHEGWIGTLVAPSRTNLLAEEVAKVVKSLRKVSSNLTESNAVEMALEHLIEYSPEEIYSLFRSIGLSGYDQDSGTLSLLLVPTSKRSERKAKRKVREFLTKNLKPLGIKEVLL